MKLIFRKCRQFSTDSLKKTALYDFHLAHGGKMVDFAGYSLPVQYPSGVKKEHKSVREECGIFDVSHMGQVTITGKDRESFIQGLTPVDLNSLSNNQASLSVLMNESGGILDDTVITKKLNSVDLVINGACKEKDMEHIMGLKESEFDGKDVSIEIHNKSLLALQGPKASDTLSKITGHDFTKMGFMMSGETEMSTRGGSKVSITRCGYTGEDGFELSISNTDCPNVAEELLASGNVTLCGLGARDSLRLEAGLCLYGNDLDASKSVVEAGLLWVVNKSRRDFSDEANKFLGWERVESEIKKKPMLKRAGFVVTKGRPVREGVLLYSDAECKNKVGSVTSGTYGVTIDCAVGMGYINRSIKLGTPLFAQIRGKVIELTTRKMPFVEANYYRI